MLELSTKKKLILQAAILALSAGSSSLTHAADGFSSSASTTTSSSLPAQGKSAVEHQRNMAAARGLSVAANGAHPDISALRYYAVRGEQNRVQAEIDRLRVLYPSWQQPENIFAEDNGQESGLWKLYGDGQYEKLQVEMERLQREVVGYSPSVELRAKLEQSQYRQEIAKSAKAKQWDAVIEKINKNPSIVAGDRDIEIIWFLAEAYAQKERPEDAHEAYKAAYKTAKNKGERRATIVKAAVLLPSEKVLELLDSVPQSKLTAELQAEANDAIARGALVRSATLGEQAPASLASQLTQLANRVRVEKNVEDAVLFAWSSFGQRDWQAAQKWFDFALTIKETPKATEGAVMSAMRLGNYARAAELVDKSLNQSTELGALFISVHARELLRERPRAVSTEFLKTYAAKTAELKNGEGSEALGWYAFNIQQLRAAQAWFEKAILWEETETAAFGLAMTASRMKDANTFNALQQTFGPKYPKVAALRYRTESRQKRRVVVKRRSTKVDRAGRLSGKIARLYQAKRYSRCLELSRALRKYGPLSASDLQMRGWCLLGAKRPAEAERAFAASVRLGGKSRTPSAYGQTLAALRTGKTNEALVIANANRLTKAQRRTVDIELLTQRARAAFKNKDYRSSIYALDKRAMMKAESRDLTLMRGWAYYHSGNYANAGEIFAVLNQQLSTHESLRGMNAVNRKIYARISHDR